MFINFRAEISQENALYIESLLDKHNLRDIWNAADRWYTIQENARGYHNIHHASRVVNNLFLIAKEPGLALIMAAMWHDAVYIPGAGDDVNERASSAALAMTYNRHKMQHVRNWEETDKIIALAKRMIDKTSVAIHLSTATLETETNFQLLYNEGLALLLDADLASLADDWESFKRAQYAIIDENYGDWTDPVNLRKCAEFLHNFLVCRDNIYRTATARVLWEEKAKANIRRLLVETEK